MKRTRDILTVVAIAGAAFIAGRLGLPIVSSSSANAQDHNHEHQDKEITPQMQAWKDASTPGTNHKYLNNLVGEFNAMVKIWETPDGEPMEFTGTVKRQWILGGRFIKETIKADSEMGPYEALGYIGYNNLDGQYESIWMENMSTAIMSGTGMYHPDKKILYMSGKYRNPADNKLITHWSKINIADSSRQTATGWQVGADGKEFKNFEGVFERK